MLITNLTQLNASKNEINCAAGNSGTVILLFTTVWWPGPRLGLNERFYLTSLCSFFFSGSTNSLNSRKWTSSCLSGWASKFGMWHLGWKSNTRNHLEKKGKLFLLFVCLFICLPKKSFQTFVDWKISHRSCSSMQSLVFRRFTIRDFIELFELKTT